MRRRAFHHKSVKAVDLFCGVGGLTHGLELEGLNVVAGIDNDNSCQYAFDQNNRAKFIDADIEAVTPKDVKRLFDGADIRILIGCAPCQPFSSLNKNKSAYKSRDERWSPLEKFLSLVQKVKPEIVSMENVAELSNEHKYPVFGKFVETLQKLGYHIHFETINVSRYGVAQRRKRLVLLASLLGEIEMIPETHSGENIVTVRNAIAHLPPIKDGQSHKSDPLHRSSKLSPKNKERIQATPKNGGGPKDWPSALIPDCYKKKSGKSFMCSVYGRMRWDEPAPTITTHCTSLGTGRFGHPTQNRAISLREAAIFQSFPASYRFAKDGEIQPSKIATQIGNAVPVLLAQAIGKSIKKHIRSRTDFR